MKAANIALCWFDGKYDEKHAKMSAEIQNVKWDDVLTEYSKRYHEQEAASSMLSNIQAIEDRYYHGSS